MEAMGLKGASRRAGVFPRQSSGGIKGL